MPTEYSLETVERLLVETRAEMKRLNAIKRPPPAVRKRIRTLQAIRRELYLQHRAHQMALPFETPCDPARF